MIMGEVDKLLQSTLSKQEAETDIVTDELAPDVKFETEFKPNFDSLKADIEHIDSRMQHINKFIVNMETQVNNLRALIANDTNSSKRGSYYTLMNTCVELNARYEDLYLKCMDIKFKYRKEQDDLAHKVKKLSHLDIPRMRKDIGDGDELGELSASKLASILTKLTDKINGADSDAVALTKTLAELQEDPDYKID